MKNGVIGVDEVGRGPLAGPITVCAVYIKDTKIIKKELFDNIIRDSKKLTKDKRINIYKTIRNNRMIKTELKYGISSRSAAFIDKHGIQYSALQCVNSCLRILMKKGVDVTDIKMNLDAGLKSTIEFVKQENFVKGDENFVEIALASIIAKESRDEYMRTLSKRYKEYNWENNVGYGTKLHIKAIKKFGVTKYHRRSYLKGYKLLERTERHI